MTYVITQSCCNDASCVSVCPVNCIHPTPDEPDFATAEILYIDAQTCIDCGACVDVCPVDAIHPDFELADEDERYLHLSERYFDDPVRASYPASRANAQTPVVEVHQRGPLRVAVVGAGPAGCYVAEELASRKGLAVDVHVFERLPAPWGLVRYGVAPDHQSTKSVTSRFHSTAARADVTMHLNVEIGTHLTHEELQAGHHAVVYASGASHDRRLDIPGEDLPGCHSATDFVAWYNGHPDHAARAFDLTVREAVIVGNGNVALDIARILTTPVDHLATTDIAEHALVALAGSRITDVTVLGRRGPAQAAFTTPELLGLLNIPDVEVCIEQQHGLVDAGLGAKVEVLREIAERPTPHAAKRIRLRFLTSPLEILGDDRVRGLRVTGNELIDDGDGVMRAKPTGEVVDLHCGMVLRSVGYRAAALPGLPFDESTATVPNDGGRVIDLDTREPVTGAYTAGWLKRGPSGGIGTNKTCAAETVAALLDDYVAGRLVEPAGDRTALTELIASRQPDALPFSGWQCIDAHERAAAHPRPRRKITTVTEMLTVARGLQESNR